MTMQIDRAALVRRAMVELVAENGLHGTSMSRVAEHAGVATGTTYVHYRSKEELVISSFVEVKRALAEAGVQGVDLTAEPEAAFDEIWRNVHESLSNDPDAARFLIQVETSPLRSRAHEAIGDDDPLVAAATAMADNLADLPPEILYDLGLAPAVRLAATDVELDPGQLDVLIRQCWKAIEK